MKKMIILAAVTAGHFALSIAALYLLLDLLAQRLAGATFDSLAAAARHAAASLNASALNGASSAAPQLWLGSGIYLLALVNSLIWASVLMSFLRWWRERHLVARPLAG